MTRAVPLEAPAFLAVLGRAVRLCCPRCGRTRLYRGAFRMHEACAACGLRYERAQGYWVGAIYVNFAATAAVALGAPLVLDWVIGLSLRRQLAVAIAAAALVPLIFFRYSRSLWLGLEFFVSETDERRERRLLRRRR